MTKSPAHKSVPIVRFELSASVNIADALPTEHYVNVSVLINFSQNTSVFTLIIISSP